MMAAGKSSVGRRLAECRGWEFFDSDRQIEAITGRTVAEIWRTDGEPAFRRLEAQVLADALASTRPRVIAAAGGTVLDPQNRRLMALHHPVVWLRARPETLAGRVGSATHRPLLDEDRLYVATEASPDGRVYALRLRTGKPLWTAKTDGIEAPLAFDGNALFAGTERGTVLRLDPETGTIRWRRRLSGAIRAAPVPSARGLAVATDADTLYLLSRETGEIQRRLPTPGAVLAAPALGGERLYLGTTEGHVLAVDLPSLGVAWDCRTGDAVYGAPALARDTLYVLARNGKLWLIPANAPLGARSFDLGIVATAGPTPVAAGVLVASVSGEVLLVSRADGSIMWRARVDGPVEEPPLVRDRQLVVVAGRGDIQVYR